MKRRGNKNKITEYPLKTKNYRREIQMSTFLGKMSTFSEKHPILLANVRKIIASKVGNFYQICANFCTKRRKMAAREGRARALHILNIATNRRHTMPPALIMPALYLLIIWIVSTLSCHLKTHHKEGEVTQYSVLSKINRSKKRT